jgi:hypothetical protein
MEDRIQINGVWYIREDSLKPESKKDFDFEITEIRELQIESENYTLVGSVLFEHERFIMPSVKIEFTGGKEHGRESEFWDNEPFLFGLATGNPESMEQMIGESEELIVACKSITKKMMELRWIN